MDETSDIHYVFELIEALDRRLPQPDRADGAKIAREGAALRARAIQRLAELEAIRGVELPSVRQSAGDLDAQR